jgi:hypothetical protein
MRPQCIYCSSTSNLNTKLTISIDDGTKVTVEICDTHAEDATIKTARDAYLKKQAMIDEVLKQAEALGISIKQPENGGLIIAQSNSQENRQPRNDHKSNATDEFWSQDDGEGWMPTSKVDAIDSRGVKPIGGNTEYGTVSAHNSHVVAGEKDILPSHLRNGKVKVDVFEGRSGAPIAIPTKRVDGTGTTHIQIVNTENDERLQRRFKNLASNSIQDKHHGFKDGYDSSTRTCPFCQGAGIAKNKSCPKCGGLGVISIL